MPLQDDTFKVAGKIDLKNVEIGKNIQIVLNYGFGTQITLKKKFEIIIV